MVKRTVDEELKEIFSKFNQINYNVGARFCFNS